MTKASFLFWALVLTIGRPAIAGATEDEIRAFIQQLTVTAKATLAKKELSLLRPLMGDELLVWHVPAGVFWRQQLLTRALLVGWPRAEGDPLSPSTVVWALDGIRHGPLFSSKEWHRPDCSEDLPLDSREGKWFLYRGDFVFDECARANAVFDSTLCETAPKWICGLPCKGSTGFPAEYTLLHHHKTEKIAHDKKGRPLH